MRRHLLSVFVFALSLCGILASVFAADGPTPEFVFTKFLPRQRDVEIDTPKPAEYAQCTVKPEKLGKASAWVAIGPNGQVVRRFVDTNNDQTVDQWRYYQNGIEVYREIDSNFNEKPDQFRWLNTGGSRWGVDSNEDAKIDEWKILSAEEASRVAINALIGGDADALRLVLVTPQDLALLKIDAAVQKEILANVSNPSQKLRDVLSKSKSLTPRSRWMRFDVASAMPSVIPADFGKSSADLLLYENAMAIIETEGEPPRNSLLVQIGEILKVGDVWKLTQLPQPIEGNQVQIAAGVLMQPSAIEAPDAANSATSGANADPRVTALVQQLQKLDAAAPSADAGPQAFVKFNIDRAAILKQLVTATAKVPAEQENWFKQLVDGLASAVQTGAFADGLAELKQLEITVKQQAKPTSPLVPYIKYRRLLAEYSVSVADAKTNAQQEKIQDDWLKDLQEFVNDHPKSEDAPDAMMQLATALEFSGKVPEARKVFEDLAAKNSKSQAGRKAAGALRRLNVKDRPLPLDFASLDGGRIDIKSFRGKAVLVLFWATWCKPCAEDLPKLRAMYQQYHSQGFEVIGVNLDTQKTVVKPYMRQNGMIWPQIFEDGGLESPPGLAFGVISLPTMFLVDKDNVVHSRPASMDDVKTALPELLGVKKPMANVPATKN